MKRSVLIIVALVLAALGVPSASVALAPPPPVSALGDTIVSPIPDTDICAHDRLPKKQVIIREWWWSQCGSQQPPYPPTAYTIRKPDQDGELVCQLKLPKQFVLTRDEYRTSDCYGDGGTEGWNALWVEKAEPGMTVCVNSPIPPRWTHGSSIPSGVCRIDFAWVINPPPLG